MIASGFGEKTNPAVLVIGPTGVGLASNGVLYVADAVASRIGAVRNALVRTTVLGNAGITVSAGGGLNGPLNLALSWP